MTPIENDTKTGVVIYMDDRYFINCRYTDCTLIFAGGDFGWVNSSFQNCKLSFEGPAGRTVNVLRMFSLLSDKFGQPAQPPQNTPIQ
jgi:hypothetical protein